MDKLRFGTAGIPFSTENRTTFNGIKQCRTLHLDCMELEFVQSVNISEQLAPEVKKTAKEHDIALTCHGQYFINLNAQEQAKINASIQRIVHAATRAAQAGAWSMTFHAGFYLQQDPKKVYDKIKHNFKEAIKQIQEQSCNIWIRPETTGKPSQFGTIDEILKLSEELEHVMPCIDFAHLHARTAGKENTEQEFKTTLEKVEKTLGKEGLNNMHIHLAGIEYTEKGERRHLPLKESDMNYAALLKVMKEFKVKGSLICESPNLETDALLLQKTYKEL